jgi:hypothetical protein
MWKRIKGKGDMSTGRDVGDLGEKSAHLHRKSQRF